jgi:DNA polymerase epsilon subunit 1
MIGHYLNVNTILVNMIEQAKYFQIPIGNLPIDAPLYACDLFFARHLYKNNYVVWCSPTSFPDLGGKEYDDYRLVSFAYSPSHMLLFLFFIFVTSCLD